MEGQAALRLRNRLLLATSLWRESTDEPLPKMPPGDPLDQIQQFELKLVDMLCEDATPDTARDVADKTWDLVHDRDDSDPVKKRVVECHERLALMTNLED
jgi:hypothetical protein